MENQNKGIRVVGHIVLMLMSLAVIVPFWLMISSSFTDEQVLLKNGYSLFPEKISLLAYEYLFSGAGNIFSAYGITLLVTAVGTVFGLLFTVLLAYALSIRDLPGRRLLAFFVFFTMLFNGGLVPTYMLYTGTFHIKNTIWALIVPSLLVSAFKVIIARSYFETSIPPEVVEASRIDGANEARILFKIVMPMALPILATLGLMTGLAYWNNWTNGLYYITDKSLYSVQQMLTEMMRNMQLLQEGGIDIGSSEIARNLPSTSLRMAIAVVGTLPIMVIYPIFQKYFVKGMTLGAVKG
ncbi:MAG: carbohydrate ABC transporter permease [Angelakisella sp.]